MNHSIKSTIIFLVVAFIFVMGLTWLINNSNENSIPPPPVNTGLEYTLAQVGTHSTATDCWTIVRTNVYDLTSWIDRHPGGSDAILFTCGKDATAAFEDQHGGQMQPENALAGFEIGIYKK